MTEEMDEAADNKVDGSSELALTSMRPRSSIDIENSSSGTTAPSARPNGAKTARMTTAIGNARMDAFVTK
ncbi:hypothetical protein RugamoR1_40540 [Rugamonas sp. R1(2021)]